MYDMSKLKKRYFDIKLKNGRVINIETPKLKVLKKISSLSKIQDSGKLTDEEINDLSEAVVLALNKNKQGYKITSKTIEEEWNIEEIMDFLNNYFEWVNDNMSSKN